MEFTGERFVPEITGAIELEHMNRYYFVINQICLMDKVVLDIASGEGYGSDLLANSAKFVYGVDISSEAIDHASLKYKKENLTFLQGNTSNIPLKDDSVDVIVSFETIEHHDKHQEMMLEIKRVLKSNGILVISSPDKQFFLSTEKNEFHIKELFYEEFQNLIKLHFIKTLFYSQTTFDGSIIALDENSHEYKKPIIANNEGVLSSILPFYNIAIGTDDIDYNPNFQLVLYKNSKDDLSYSDFELAQKSIRDTKAYRLGKFILKPLSFLRNVFFIK